MTAVATRLEALLTSVVNALGPDRARVALVLEPAEQAVRWPVEASAQAVTQVLKNALQASAKQVTLRGAAEDAHVDLTVEDDGLGMDAATLARVGEPFFTTRPGEGQGLGVFIARALVEHLGGSVTIESAPRQGTRVRLRLPVEVRG